MFFIVCNIELDSIISMR